MPFSTEQSSFDVCKLDEFLDLMKEHDQSVMITPIVQQVQCCLTYRKGKLINAAHKGDGLMGLSLPDYVTKSMFPKRLDINMLYMHGFITLSNASMGLGEFTTELVNILRDPIAFKENKQRLKFFVTQCRDEDQPDLNVLESLDLLEDNFETHVDLATVSSLKDVIANLYERDKDCGYALDAYAVRGVNYSDLTLPWVTPLSIEKLIIPFEVAKDIKR